MPVKATIFDGTTHRPYTPQDAQALSADTPYAWIDVVVTEPGDADVMPLLKQIGFTDVVAAYTTRAYSSGMFQVFGDNMLGSTYVSADSDQNPPVLVHCVWKKGCFLTLRQGGDKAVAAALDEFKPRASVLFASPGPVPGIIMQLLLDSIDRQLTTLQTQVALLDEEIIVTSNPNQLTSLQQVRKPLEDLGTRLPTYAENVKVSLIDPGSIPGIDQEGVHALQTYSACVNDIVARIDSAAGDIRSAIQDYQGQVSTKQGNRINQLTLVSIIFLPISFLTGYFGMNFQFLVNESMSFAAWFLLGAVLPVVCVVLSMALLRRGGFKVGHPLRFHLGDRHRK